MSDRAWLARAACRDEPTSTFYPNEWTEKDKVDRARKICAGCEVSTECLADAFEHHEHDGIRAGFTPEQRAQLRRRRKAS